MRSSKRSIALILAVSSLFCSAAFGGTVDISTGLANWQVGGETPVSGGDPLSASKSTAASVGLLTTTAVPLIPNPGWNAPFAGSSWVGPGIDSASTGDAPGYYVYELDLGTLAAGHYAITGTLGVGSGSAYADNTLISPVFLTTDEGVFQAPLSPNYPAGNNSDSGYVSPIDYGFEFGFTVPALPSGSKGTSSSYLDFVVYNQLVDPGSNDSNNPTGFDLAAGLTAVPLPPAVEGGLVLIGSVGFCRMRRKLVGTNFGYSVR
jgi:hypothetical protein